MLDPSPVLWFQPTGIEKNPQFPNVIELADTGLNSLNELCCVPRPILLDADGPNVGSLKSESLVLQSLLHEYQSSSSWIDRFNEDFLGFDFRRKPDKSVNVFRRIRDAWQ